MRLRKVWLTALCALTMLTIGGIAYQSSGRGVEVKTVTTDPLTSAVIARGWIDSVNHFRVVSGPSGGGTITQLDVHEGEIVKQGMVLATLDQHGVRDAALKQAQLSLALAVQEQNRLYSGEREATLAALVPKMNYDRAVLEQDRVEATRGDTLMHRAVIAADDNERRRLAVVEAEQAMLGSQASLASARFQLEGDRKEAAIRVAQDAASVQEAQAGLELTLVRAPVDGTILNVSTRAGQQIGPDGIVSIADLSHLMISANVDAEDAPRIGTGDTATVQPLNMTLRLTGKVFRVVNRVFSSEQPTSDVLVGRDARVVEVDIALDKPAALPPFIGAEVTATIYVH